jgi:type II secretory pathway component PulJ
MSDGLKKMQSSVQIIPNRKAEWGFTSLELLVAMTVTAILATTIYMTYHFSLKQLKTWQHRTDLERDASLCIDRFVGDVQTASFILIGANEVLIIRDPNDSIAYVFEDSLLFRNRYPMNSRDVSVIDWQVRWIVNPEKLNKQASESPDSRDPNLPELRMIQVMMTFRTGGSGLALRTSVLPRNLKQDWGI